MVVMSLITCVISLELSPSLRTVSEAPLLVSTAVCATFEAWAELPAISRIDALISSVAAATLPAVCVSFSLTEARRMAESLSVRAECAIWRMALPTCVLMSAMYSVRSRSPSTLTVSRRTPIERNTDSM